jgi:hypothetical protein
MVAKETHPGYGCGTGTALLGAACLEACTNACLELADHVNEFLVNAIAETAACAIVGTRTRLLCGHATTY